MQSHHKKSFAAEQLARRKKISPLPWIIAVTVFVIAAAGYVGYSRFAKESPQELAVKMEIRD